MIYAGSNGNSGLCARPTSHLTEFVELYYGRGDESNKVTERSQGEKQDANRKLEILRPICKRSVFTFHL
jgi:hypothetical protein